MAAAPTEVVRCVSTGPLHQSLVVFVVRWFEQASKDVEGESVLTFHAVRIP